MAYIQDDDVQSSGQPQGQSAQGADLASPQSANPTSGASSSDVGSNVSTAGVGDGGQGGWTNIQAYLNANKGNNATATKLASDVGSKFDADQKRITDDADSKKQANASMYQAPANVEIPELKNTADTDSKDPSGELYGNEISDMVGVDRTHPKGWVDPTATWGGGEVDTSPYQSYIDTAKGFIGNKPQAQVGVAYSPDSSVQDIGNQLGDDTQFGTLLNKTYSNAAGGQISSGQLALQKQLDQDNPEISNQRTALDARYKALKDLAGGKSKEVNDDTAAKSEAYKTAQGSAKDSLSSAMRNIEVGGVTNEEAPRYKAIMQALGLG